MRRTGDAPMFCASQFAGTGVIRVGDEFVAVTSPTWYTALVSASDVRRQRALPSASVVKATSLPP
eukprot:5618192-Pleurochrysis_carterae.AAC.1